MIYKRKLKGRTDYKKRMDLLKSRKLRLVIRKSLKNIWAQIIQFNINGDKVLLSAHTNELKKYGWKSAKRNIPTAYLVGLLIGIKAKSKNIKEAILDIGFYRSIKGSIIYSLLKGAIDAGLKVPHSKDIFPSEDRIKGKHISEDIQKDFEEVKLKILK